MDGTPLELGHGGTGVTYKAIDINPRCAVALKVINARFIGDESARRKNRRFRGAFLVTNETGEVILLKEAPRPD